MSILYSVHTRTHLSFRMTLSRIQDENLYTVMLNPYYSKLLYLVN